MIRIKNSISTFKDRLINISGEESLSRFSLTVVIALDIFILMVVFQGLDDHTRQLTSPSEYVPYECKDAFINQNWSEANFLTKLQTLVLSEHNNYSYRIDSRLKKTDTLGIHDVCREFYENTRKIAKNSELKTLFIDRQAFIKEKNQLTRNLKKSKDVYDTSLLENIADKKRAGKELPAVTAAISSDKVQIEKVTHKIARIETKISAHPQIKVLKVMISAEKEFRQKIVDDYKKFQKFYPLKELGWQSLFLLPLFIAFYIWSSRSVKKKIVSRH